MRKKENTNRAETLRALGIVFAVLLIILGHRIYTQNQIINDYRKESTAAAIEQYGGKEMEFTGTVISSERPFGIGSSLLAIEIDTGDINVVAYTKEEVTVGQKVTLQGTCVEFRDGEKVVVVLDSTTIK